MTFKDLRRFLTIEQQRQQQLENNHNSEQEKAFIQSCKSMPFYLWNLSNEEHNKLALKTKNRCCFNHFIGLPQKNGVKHSLYAYEKTIYDFLQFGKTETSLLLPQQKKHSYILKSTGLGITEIMLRIIAFFALTRKDFLPGDKIAIVTGPNINLAVSLIKRLKSLFQQNQETFFNTKENVVVLNGIWCEAYPSHHIDSMRGLDRLKFIFADEASFFSTSEPVLDVIERYIAKSNPYIVLVSTPNKPNDSDIMYKISRQPDNECLYHRLMLPYTVGLDTGLGGIFSQKDIELAKKSASWSREYNLQFLGETGNVFLPNKIDEAIQAGSISESLELYKQLSEKIPVLDTFYYLGIDPSWGSSAFAVVLVAILNEKIHVLESKQLWRSEFPQAINQVGRIMQHYSLTRNNLKILVDSSSPATIAAIKNIAGDDPKYVELMSYRKKIGTDPMRDFCVLPINFNHDTKRQILLNVKEILDEGLLAINGVNHQDLITSLRTAIATDLILDKKNTTFSDLIDALSLACMRVNVNQQETQRYDITA